MIVIDKLNNYINNHSHEDINYNIALFIIDNMESIVDFNITELSKKCFVSQATVSRFIKKLGYEDYNEFKEECLGYVENIKDKICNEYADINLLNEDLKIIYSKIDSKEIEKVVSDIKKYDKIYVSGLNYCYLMAQYFQMECSFLGKAIRIIEDNGEIQDIEEDSLLLIITTTGNYFNINRPMKEHIKNCNCSKILFSIRDLDEKIKELFDRSLILNMNSNVRNSRYIIMALLDSILDKLKEEK